jgi:NADP-dependent 3-hydroxy acid dehydrogenase YdfG
MREPWTVLVTGASTGLGLALSHQLLGSTTHRLILTARASSLHRFGEAGIVESERVWLRPLDVTDCGQRRAVVAEADARWGGVDVLINNAGVMYRAVLEHLSDRERFAQMDVNYLGPMDMVRLVLPRMRDKRSGRIINISSVGGMMAMPTMAAYSASKFALEGASESLYYEVKPWNIRVTLVQPGFVHSEAYQNVRFTDASQRSRDDVNEAYHAHYENMGPFIARLMNWSRATPDRVARRIIRVMHKRNPPLRAAGSIDAYLFSALRRISPRILYHWVLYQSLPHIRNWGRELPEATPETPATAPEVAEPPDRGTG